MVAATMITSSASRSPSAISSRSWPPGGITGIDDRSTFSYVIATSTQGNSLNQDLNGVGANYNGASTWGALGALGDPVSPFAVVPEVNPAFAVIALLGVIIAHRQRKSWRRERAA